MLGGPAKTSYNPNGDYEIQQPPNDGISSLGFNTPNPSNAKQFLSATSWDNGVRLWEVNSPTSVTPKMSMQHDQPPLAHDWNQEGNTIFSGGCDKQAKMWDLASNQQRQIASHDAPIKEIKWIQSMNLLVTGSWDKSLRYWDLRQNQPAFTFYMPERCYSLSVEHPLMVVATAERGILEFDLNNPKQPHKQIQSPLKYQTRCVSCFAEKNGYLVGSIEGRVAVQYLAESDGNKNFTFKCHRENNGTDVYSVNSISVHPKHGTFVTAGQNGAMYFWDKDNQTRLKVFERCDQSISCAKFNPEGNLLAYAVSYDWGQGYQYYNPNINKNYILLHSVKDTEVQRRDKNKNKPNRR